MLFERSYYYCLLDGGVREDVPPIGLIVGVVLGVIFLILMLVGLKLYIRRRNRVADISKVDYVESTMALVRPVLLFLASFLPLVVEIAHAGRRKRRP